MARRNRHRLEDDEDEEVTPDEIEEIELEAVVWDLRCYACKTRAYPLPFYSSRRTKN